MLSADQGFTVIHGMAAGLDGESLQYRWLEDELTLLGWLSVGAGGEADLNLGTLDYPSVGEHMLVLEVAAGDATGSDSMVLTVRNTPPDIQPAPSSQAVTVGTDAIVLRGDVADFDGDTLQYQWLKDGQTLSYGTARTLRSGQRTALAELVIPSDDGRFGVGTHVVELSVSDGANEPVSKTVSIGIIEDRSSRPHRNR